MNSIVKSKKTTLFLGTLFISSLVLAQEEPVTEALSVVQNSSIHKQLGLSSTMLFIVMTGFTLLLLAVVWSMASSTKNILQYKQDQIKKKNNNAKKLLALFLLTFSTGAMAADGGTVAKSLISFPDSIFWAYIVVDVVLIMIIFYLAGIVRGTISDIIVLRKMFRWRKIGKTLTNAVPIEEEGSILLDHDYDGITELDNDLPPWWKYGFYITIVWAVGYFFYYQVFEIGDLQEAEYLASIEKGEREIAEYKAAHPEMITAENVELLTDASGLAQGRLIYDQKCQSCHMDAGAGGVGPNLTDNYWLHGSDLGSVFVTISEGVPEKGMAAWKTMIPANEIQAVASYILQLEPIAPPKGKDPQGDIVE
ncbi:MAG: mono/diheme cytochrome c family protein [Crocinitomix sp.]|jgi:mono/diheme cytochrome c family protein